MNLMSYKAVAIIATALLLKTVSTYSIDYAPLTLSRMMLLADSIVVVHVLHSGNDFYRIQPVVTLKGYVINEQLDVYEYTQWKTGKVLANADEVIMFLQRNPKNQQWYVIGADSEGFMPVVDGWIYLHGIRIDHMEMKEYRIHGNHMLAVRVGKNDLLVLIEDLMQCFRNNDKNKIAVMQICSDKKLDELRNRSDLHRSIFNEMTNVMH